MPVVLVVLILAVLVAVGLVAAGRGALLSDAPPDRAPFALPETLTPADLREIRFAAAFRGYRMDQVDELLDRLLAELDRRDARIAELETASAPSSGEPHPAGDDVLRPATAED